jgi:hypothetical protein
MLRKAIKLDFSYELKDKVKGMTPYEFACN